MAAQDTEHYENLMIESGIPCYDCRRVISMTNEIDIYLHGEAVYCPACGQQLDWWRAVLESVRWGKHFPSSALAAVGASCAFIQEPFIRGRFQTINFADYGIPENAKILHLDYSSIGAAALFPVEIAAHSRPRRALPHKIGLFPVPAQHERRRKTRLLVAVVWVLPSKDDISWENLVMAFAAYTQQEFASAMLSANVALEVLLGRILMEFLGPRIRGVTPGRRTKFAEEFLTNGATYGYQLKVLLPLVVELTSAPTLIEELLRRLDTLRRLRNDLAHKGHITAWQSKNDEERGNHAAELLCATLFGFRYCQLLEKYIQKMRGDTTSQLKPA